MPECAFRFPSTQFMLAAFSGVRSMQGKTVLVVEDDPKVRALLRENLAVAGGILAHFDHPVRPDGILDWFLRS